MFGPFIGYDFVAVVDFILFEDAVTFTSDLAGPVVGNVELSRCLDVDATVVVAELLFHSLKGGTRGPAVVGPTVLVIAGACIHAGSVGIIGAANELTAAVVSAASASNRSFSIC